MPPLLPITIALIAGILLQSFGISAIVILLPLAMTIIMLFRKLYSMAIITLSGIMGFIISLVLAPDPFNSFQADEANYSGVVKEIKNMIHPGV